MRIGITYNLKSEDYNIHPQHLLVDDAFEEFDTDSTIDAIASVLEGAGHSVVKLGWGRPAIRRLLSEDIDFVFNISEGYWGRNREAHIPAALEMFEIPYSGSDPLSLSLALDKVIAKRVLGQAGIKTPAYCAINRLKDAERANRKLRYPLFVKPAWEGSSKGIQYSSKVRNKQDLIASVECLLKNYPNQPALAEEYITGREFTVGVLGNEDPAVLGIMQICAKDGKDFFYSKEVKRDWQNKITYECPAKVDASLKGALERIAIDAFKAFQCRDVARMDLRVDVSGDVYFLEINPLPGLSPENADLVIMANKMGWTYQRLITAIFNHAVSRHSLTNVAANEKI